MLELANFWRFRKYWTHMKVLLNCGRTNQVENTSKPIMETRMIGQKKNSENFGNSIFTGENPR